MKKLFLNLAAVIILLAVICPLSANAVSLTTSTSEMKVGEIVDVTVTTDQPLESIEFELTFDNTKYEFVAPKNQELGDDEIDSAMANLVSANTVRVSAVDTTGNKKAKDIVLQFKAIENGTSIPFTISNYEFGENGRANTTEKLANLTIKVDKIGGKSDGTGGGGAPQPVNDAGQVITQLPQTNSVVSEGLYSKVGDIQIGNLEYVVPYILKTPKESLTEAAIKSEYPTATVSGIKNFTVLNGTYKVLVYGDVNQDGKITTTDALMVYRKDQLTDIQKEAADVNHDGVVNADDAKLIQRFIIETHKIDSIPVDEQPGRYTKIPLVEKVTSISNDLTVTRSYGQQTTVGTFKSESDMPLISANMFDTTEFKLIINGTEVTDSNYKGSMLMVSLPDANGVVEVILLPKEVGSYEIIPVVQGDTIKGGYIEASSSIKCTVVEDKQVTKMKLKYTNGANTVDAYDSDNPSTVEIPINREENFRKLKIELYHDYNQQNVEPVNVTDQYDFSAIHFSYTPTDASKPVLSNTAGVNTNKEIVLATNSAAIVGNTGTMSIQLDNAVLSFNIDITAVELERTSLTLGTQTHTAGESNQNITVYTGYTVDNVYTPDNNTVVINNKLYTVLPISTKDIDNCVRKVINKFVTTSTRVTPNWGNIVLNGCASTDKVNYVCLKLENGVYVEKPSSTSTNIDAIGFAVKDITAATADTAVVTARIVNDGQDKIKVNLNVDIQVLPAKNNVTADAMLKTSAEEQSKLEIKNSIDKNSTSKAEKANYTIEYYYDEKVDEKKTETVESAVGEKVTAETIKDKVKANMTEGYKVNEKEAFTELIVDKDTSKNVIKVYYITEEADKEKTDKNGKVEDVVKDDEKDSTTGETKLENQDKPKDEGTEKDTATQKPATNDASASTTTRPAESSSNVQSAPVTTAKPAETTQAPKASDTITTSNEDKEEVKK